MYIESIEIENCRLFRRGVAYRPAAHGRHRRANGSGKSTLIDVFSFLKDSLAHNVAVSRCGGFRELLSRGERA